MVGGVALLIVPGGGALAVGLMVVSGTASVASVALEIEDRVAKEGTLKFDRRLVLDLMTVVSTGMGFGGFTNTLKAATHVGKTRFMLAMVGFDAAQGFIIAGDTLRTLTLIDANTAVKLANATGDERIKILADRDRQVAEVIGGAVVSGGFMLVSLGGGLKQVVATTRAGRQVSVREPVKLLGEQGGPALTEAVAKGQITHDSRAVVLTEPEMQFLEGHLLKPTIDPMAKPWIDSGSPAAKTPADVPARPLTTDVPAKPPTTDVPAKPPTSEAPATTPTPDVPAKPPTFEGPATTPTPDATAKPPKSETPVKPRTSEAPAKGPTPEGPTKPPASDVTAKPTMSDVPAKPPTSETPATPPTSETPAKPPTSGAPPRTGESEPTASKPEAQARTPAKESAKEPAVEPAKTTKPAGPKRIDEPVPGLYDSIDLHGSPAGWTVHDAPPSRDSATGKVLYHTDVVAPDGTSGYIERTYDPKTGTLVMENAFLTGLPKWVDVGVPMSPGKGTPTITYLTVRQMKQMRIKFGGLKKVKMSTIQNIEAVMQLEQMKRQGKTLAEAIPNTHSVKYATTTIEQSGHAVAKIEADMTNAFPWKLSDMMDRFGMAPIDRQALFKTYKLGPDDMVTVNYDIKIDVSPHPKNP